MRKSEQNDCYICGIGKNKEIICDDCRREVKEVARQYKITKDEATQILHKFMKATQNKYNNLDDFIKQKEYVSLRQIAKKCGHNYKWQSDKYKRLFYEVEAKGVTVYKLQKHLGYVERIIEKKDLRRVIDILKNIPVMKEAEWIWG